MKFKLLVFIVFFFTFIISCRHESGEIDYDYLPELKFIAGSNYISNDTVLPLNYSFTVSVQFNSNNKSKSNIKNFKVYRIHNTDTIVATDSAVDVISDSYLLHYTTRSDISQETWIFSIMDGTGEKASKSFMITTQHYYPSLTVIFEKNFIPVNSTITIALQGKYNVESAQALTNLNIIRTFKNVSEVVMDSNISVFEISSFLNYQAMPEEGTETWEFTLEDASGESVVVSEDVYTVILMTDEHYGTIWNRLGPNNYAWDLIANTSRTETDADDTKDMANLSDSVYASAPYFFLNSWTAMNTSLYKRANYIDYDQVSLPEAIDAYTGGSIVLPPNSSATGLSMGDVYVGKLRSAETYVVIQVLNVDYTDSDNLDKIEFRYKK